MEFMCTFCGKAKGNAADWLLGFEGKTKAMKGGVTLLNKLDPGASGRAKCDSVLLARMSDEVPARKLWRQLVGSVVSRRDA